MTTAATMNAFRFATGSRRPRQLLLLLLLILAAASPSRATASAGAGASSVFPKGLAAWTSKHPKGTALVAGLGSYLAYSFGVQKYANHVVSKMIAVPRPEKVPQPETDEAPIFASDLRKTISKITNLVTNPADRIKWNQWIARNDPKLDAPITKETILSWVSRTDTEHSQTPLFRFAYRTHADHEEAAAYYKPFCTWQRFRFTFETIAKMVFTEPTNNKRGAIANVQMTDYFILFGILKAHVTWRGTVVKGGKSDYKIDWDSTDLKTFLPWTKHRPKLVPNPAASTAASKVPWDVIKAEDGMICLRRGTVGYLVFDSKKR